VTFGLSGAPVSLRVNYGGKNKGRVRAVRIEILKVSPVARLYNGGSTVSLIWSGAPAVFFSSKADHGRHPRQGLRRAPVPEAQVTFHWHCRGSIELSVCRVRNGVSWASLDNIVDFERRNARALDACVDHRGIPGTHGPICSRSQHASGGPGNGIGAVVWYRKHFTLDNGYNAERYSSNLKAHTLARRYISMATP